MPANAEQIRAVMARLNPEQQQQFLAELQKRQAATSGDVPSLRAEAGMGGGGDVDTSALERFAGGVWQNVNPVNLAKGLAQAVVHPLDTIQGAGEQMGQQWEKAGQAWNEGRYSEALGHGAAGSIPLLGPAAAAAGERIGTGDVAGGLGEGVGLLLPVLGPRGVKAGVKQLGSLPVGGKLATVLEGKAADKVAGVMRPEVGPNKLRFGNKAREVAPAIAKDLAEEGAPLTKGGFHDAVKTKLAEATNALDEAADARLPNQAFDTGEILKSLRAKRDALTAQNVTVQGKKGPIPVGKAVVPAPNAARVAVIDEAIKAVEELGGLNRKVGYEPIRRIRQAYDQQAKVAYNPSMTQDFLRQKGGALGASDVSGALRDALAKWDPVTAEANAQYSLYKAADDVMTAAAETERVRPKVGRQLMARLTGVLGGGAQAGVPGAVAGYLGAPIIDSVMSSGITTQLKTAALMQKLAEAIRRRDLNTANSLSDQLKRVSASGVTAYGASGSRATEPVAP
jgi:hypothetical protein